MALFLVVIYLPPKSYSQQPRIPTSDILQIWEHSCVKHIEKGELNRAVQNLNVMNWQCDNKKWLNLSGDADMAVALKALEDAKRARQNYLSINKQWICFPKAAIQNQKKQQFYKTLGRQIFQYLKNKGINEDVAYVIISQAALETSWGTRVRGNNLFNIKGTYNGESVSFVTHEQLRNGQWVQLTDSFRKYPSIEESVGDYLDLLKTKWSKSYLATSSGGTVEKFIEGLQAGKDGGYATDKSYSDKLRFLYKMIKEGLFQSDVVPTYLKCLGRESELNQIMESLNGKK